jgi:hypothetical protein
MDAGDSKQLFAPASFDCYGQDAGEIPRVIITLAAVDRAEAERKTCQATPVRRKTVSTRVVYGLFRALGCSSTRAGIMMLGRPADPSKTQTWAIVPRCVFCGR